MDGLFSHAQEPLDPTAQEPASAPTVTVTATVPGDAIQASEGFLDYLHLWWPAGLYSVSGPGTYLWWDEEGWAEEGEDGRRTVWGNTEEWDAPHGGSLRVQLPGAEGALWTLSVKENGTTSEVSLTAPLPTHLPHAPEVTRSAREESGPALPDEEIDPHSQGADSRAAGQVPEDLWQQIMGLYARFMGGSTH